MSSNTRWSHSVELSIQKWIWQQEHQTEGVETAEGHPVEESSSVISNIIWYNLGLLTLASPLI